MNKPALKRASGERKAETNHAVLRQAMLKRLPRRLTTTAQVSFPAVPALLDHYVGVLGTTFAALGRTFSDKELGHLRGILEKKLDEGWKASPFAKVFVSYETDPLPKTSLSYRISVNTAGIAEEYEHWVKTREPPLFGARPDAKVMSLAHSLGAPAEVPVLDIGAGTGRNALPLARAGFPTDAVELAPALVDVLKAEVAEGQLGVRVFQGDMLDGSLGLPRAHYRLAILAEVVASHVRSAGQLRALFTRAAELLAPGAMIVLNAFLTREGYKPDPVVQQLSQVFWSCLFTRRELAEALEGLPFELASDESVYDFEKAHLPAEAWPPTGWFEEWSRGLDLFELAPEKSPLELRWLVYRRH